MLLHQALASYQFMGFGASSPSTHLKLFKVHISISFILFSLVCFQSVYYIRRILVLSGEVELSSN